MSAVAQTGPGGITLSVPALDQPVIERCPECGHVEPAPFTVRWLAAYLGLPGPTITEVPVYCAECAPLYRAGAFEERD